MDATDAKTQKIEPDPIFLDGLKFRKQCPNVIDTMWDRINFFNVLKFRIQYADL